MANELNFSVWERETFLNNYDVLIVGAGLVGLQTAINLKEYASSLKIGVLEAGFLPSGASTKNAGFACFGSVSEVLALLNNASEKEVLAITFKKFEGLNLLRKHFNDADIGYQPIGNYEIFRTTDNELSDKCLHKIDDLNALLSDAIGHADIYADASAEIKNYGFKNVSAMIFNKYEGMLHTGKLMAALLQKAAALGIFVFSSTPVLGYHPQKKSLLVETKNGLLSTKKLVFATNVFAKEFFADLDLTPGRGQVLVTKPLKKPGFEGAFHLDEGYTYFRTINNRILIGGGRNLAFADECTTVLETTDLIQNHLKTTLKSYVLPNEDFEIDYSWSGVMAFGKELSPIIKKVSDGVFVAVRCNGMGVAISASVALEASNLILKDI